jgi:hypothetical protein
LPWPVEALHDPAIGKFRKQPIDRLVQPELALLCQDHRRRGGDRLGHRGDAEYRVAPDGVAVAQCPHANCVDLHLAMTADQGNDAGDLAALDVAGHDGMQAVQSSLR